MLIQNTSKQREKKYKPKKINESLSSCNAKTFKVQGTH